jgi:hypothetical protein
MGGEESKPRIRVAAAATAYILIGLYFLVFSIPDFNLALLSIIGLGSVIAGLGLYMFKRWGFWLASAVFPLLATASISTLIFSLKIPVQDSTFTPIILDTSLAIVFILSIVSFLTVISVRNSFKP